VDGDLKGVCKGIDPHLQGMEKHGWPVRAEFHLRLGLQRGHGGVEIILAAELQDQTDDILRIDFDGRHAGSEGREERRGDNLRSELAVGWREGGGLKRWGRFGCG
jgi:hypothetical protein